MATYEGDEKRAQAQIDLYETTVAYANDVHTAIYNNYKTMIAKADQISSVNSESEVNREKTGYVYNARSTFVLLDAVLTMLIFTIAIIYGLRYVWPNPYELSHWMILFLILLLPLLVQRIFNKSSIFLPVNVYAMWASK
jgi:hypothetical protein